MGTFLGRVCIKDTVPWNNEQGTTASNSQKKAYAWTLVNKRVFKNDSSSVRVQYMYITTTEKGYLLPARL